MNAIRTVSETDDVHVIEGLGIPFGGPFRGSDTYRSRATAATNFHWDLFPDVAPEADATRSAPEPHFIRPTTYQHGLDSDVGLSRVGGWSPIRSSDKGVWVQAQLDKHHEYYTAIRELLDADALGFSIGSAEHSVRFDQDRNWVEWPAYELALTPTPSNPWAAIATRTAEFVNIVGATVDENVDATIEHGVERAYRAAADDVACATAIAGQLAYLMGCEDDEPDQLAELRTAFEAVSRFIVAEAAEIGTPEDEAEEMPVAPAYMSAIRAGRRNSTSDQSLIDTIHEASATLGATAHAAPDGQPNDDSPPTEAPADAARSGDALPAVLRIVERPDPAAVRAHLDAEAERVGRETAERLMRR